MASASIQNPVTNHHQQEQHFEAIPSSTYESSTHDQIGLIWIDDEPNDKAKEALKHLFETLLTFNDPDEFLHTMASDDWRDMPYFVLVSGRYGQRLVKDHLQPLPNVTYIYVYCMDEVKHRQWADHYDKVHCVSNDFKKILTMIERDLQSNSNPKMKPSTKTTTAGLNQQAKEKTKHDRYITDNNLWDQLALVLLLHQSSDDNNSKQDFYEFSKNFISTRENDHENKRCLTELNEFMNTFVPEESIIWYTSDTFLYDLLMSNIYSNDLNSLWSLRYYCTAFYTSLIEENKKFLQEHSSKMITLYHGTHLTSDEFDLLKGNLGQTIIVNKIYSTSVDCQQALALIKSNNNSAQTVPVLMEITVNLELNQYSPFAEIKHNEGERETLFCFGSKFRLMKIEYHEDKQFWLIGIQLCRTIDDNVIELYNYYKNTLFELHNTTYAYGKILYYKGLFANAEMYLNLALTNETEQLTQIQCDLCEFYMRNGDYDRAADLHTQALTSQSDNFHIHILGCYLKILTKDSDNARSSLEKIIADHQNNPLILTKAYVGLGFISVFQSNIQYALDLFILADNAAREYLPHNHPERAKILICMGYANYANNNINDAHECFQTAYDLQKQCLSQSHPDIAKTYIGFARIQSANKNMKQALKYLKEALEIQIETYSSISDQHTEILATEHDIDTLQKKNSLRSRRYLLDYI
ncbi:unnamed protein product [Didymodactylos carnosus]|uniref:Uncharacterized protein n=1 Tax=Didymodactylos carnosus TaxID=1234261 RepID=A0A8S2DP03_9BILA|nr:unnamed protein product [Didymodactylos carnosus]CAF3733575.1 unnamed protein product [Didymodactylos carnosus]CAF4462380.1 unnamed protein product [Didymodactylos carnosus]